MSDNAQGVLWLDTPPCSFLPPGEGPANLKTYQLCLLEPISNNALSTCHIPSTVL